MAQETTRVITNGEQAGHQGASTQQLRESIDRTRADITATLGAIEARLNPTTVKETVSQGIEAATQAVREQTIGKVENMVHKAERTIGDVRGSIVDTIRDNPVPALMTGIGLAWLFMNRRSRSSGERLPEVRGYRAETYGDYRVEGPGMVAGLEERNAQGSAGELGERVKEGAGRIAEKMQDTAEGVAQKVQSAAEGVTERVQETAHQVSETARRAAGTVADRAGQVAQQTRVQARRMEDRVQESFFANPIAFAALAIAAGAALGLALPRTRREDEWMGEARDRLLEKAQSSAQSAVQKAEQVAKSVVAEPQRVLPAPPVT